MDDTVFLSYIHNIMTNEMRWGMPENGGVTPSFTRWVAMVNQWGMVISPSWIGIPNILGIAKSLWKCGDEHIKSNSLFNVKGENQRSQCMLAMPKECKMIQYNDIHIYITYEYEHGMAPINGTLEACDWTSWKWLAENVPQCQHPITQ